MKQRHIFIVIALIIIGFVIIFPNKMIFPGTLYEAHSEIENNCFACHKIGSGTPNENCISCHKISNINQNNGILKFHESIQNQSCISCHSDHKGLDSKLALNKFDHLLLPLKDRNSCISCHKQPKNELHNQVTNSCISCHSTESWIVVSNFDHNLINEKSRNNCVSCHQSPKDNFHSISSTNCLSCHSMKIWKPSTFNHNKLFVLDNEHNVSCVTCHKTNDYKTYTCFGCHEHSMNNIRNEHEEEGVLNFTDCIKCHKNANEHDIKMSENDVKKYIDKEFKNKEESDD
jgi:hypothetical protein